MGYLHIDNLYRNQSILLFRKAYALEKIHGTSAHITFRRKIIGPPTEENGPQAAEAEIGVFAGGENYVNFRALFDLEDLKRRFLEAGPDRMTVFGEAYGGKQQGMKETYGPKLKFVAFDVKMNRGGDEDGIWLDVESATKMVQKLGLEFVAWNLVDTDIESLDRERDLPSRQAVRNGITEPRIAEGVVLRPPIEVHTNNGARIIAKHKRPEFSERTSKRDTRVTPEKQAVLTRADDIANEWVTATRLEHVIDRFKAQHGRFPENTDTRTIIDGMVEDITREASGEIVESKEAVRAIGSNTAKLFMRLHRKRLSTDIQETSCR